MDVPFRVGNGFGSNEFYVVLVVSSDVNHCVCFGSELVSVYVVSFNGDVDGACVAVSVVEHQGDVPLLALCTTRLRSKVCLTEGHGR